MKLTERQYRQMLRFVRLLASYGCAGAPGCEPPTVDAATGKREGGLCGPCQAEEWLRENAQPPQRKGKT